MLGRDILARAKNGTGKTGAYIIPSIDVTKDHIPAMAIVSRGVRGGTNLKNEFNRIHENVHVIIATPGRNLDLMEERVAQMDRYKVLVLGEADRLLS
ncbi:hypothetical protein V5799_027802 [Amblyomma americanum]|uniref:DEAD/DEAH-box helicase domain-containing protein n=1 Tax=Amblyomma americanum TaxID=6943 RepID=A0AAQ4DEP0_AMBAM